MIERYTLPEMGAVWDEENKFQKWLDVEIAVCEVHAEMGTIPREALEEIRRKPRSRCPNQRDRKKPRTTTSSRFTTALAEKIGPSARFVHYGLTSSDVVDTANALLLRDTCDFVAEENRRFYGGPETSSLRIQRHSTGRRTHGIHAEPTSFGLTFALWYDEMRRNRVRLLKARETVAVGKISGAVGAFAHLDPEVEERVCERLGIALRRCRRR